MMQKYKRILRANQAEAVDGSGLRRDHWKTKGMLTKRTTGKKDQFRAASSSSLPTQPRGGRLSKPPETSSPQLYDSSNPNPSTTERTARCICGLRSFVRHLNEFQCHLYASRSHYSAETWTKTTRRHTVCCSVSIIMPPPRGH